MKHYFTGECLYKHCFNAQLTGECLLKHSVTGECLYKHSFNKNHKFYTGVSTKVTDSSDSFIDGVVLQRLHKPIMKITIIIITITHIAISIMRNVVGGVLLTVLNKTSGFSDRKSWIKSILDR